MVPKIWREPNYGSRQITLPTYGSYWYLYYMPKHIIKQGTPPRTFWWEQAMNVELLPMHPDEATGGGGVTPFLLMKEKVGRGGRDLVTRRGLPNQ